MMPGVDGFEFLKEIRSDEALQRVPVVIVSARAGEEASVDGLLAGASDYLVKPFSSRELLARITTQVALARARAAEQAANLRLHSLFAAAPVAVSVVRGPELVFELANARYEQMVGRKGLVGKPLKAAFPELPDNAPVFEMLLKSGARARPSWRTSIPVTMDRKGHGALEEVFLHVHMPAHRRARRNGRHDLDRRGRRHGTRPIAARAREPRPTVNRPREPRRKPQARSRTSFSSTASHELRTPLSAILGWARLLAAGKLAAADTTAGGRKPSSAMHERRFS
jgi:signal transduction histidine kinase